MRFSGADPRRAIAHGNGRDPKAFHGGGIAAHAGNALAEGAELTLLCELVHGNALLDILVLGFYGRKAGDIGADQQHHQLEVIRLL